LALAQCAALAAPSGTWLLVDRAEIEAARAKAEKFPWAREALRNVMEGADRALKGPVALPDRGGQWPHWYSCKLDGARLRTVSPTEHRCTQCGTVYRGEPYDSVVLLGVHNGYSRGARDLGLAFRFTGRQEYAARAREILLAYAGRYQSYRRHTTRDEDRVGGGKVSAQTLDESTWLIPLVWGYALVRDTLAAEDRARIENGVLAPAADVIREHKMSIHNIQCWKNSAVGLVGFATGREDLIKEAIDDPDRGFRAQVARGVTDDGLWYEGSLGYHHYTMQAIWPLAEAARHAGINLYSERLSTLWDAPLALAFPNGDPPGFNDNNGSPPVRFSNLYEIAFARWNRPAYGRLAAAGNRATLEALLYGRDEVPSGAMIPTESVLLKAAGYAMLRTPGAAAAVRFGMHGGGHGHPDKLNVVTFGGGRMWGLDPGSIAYGVPLHQEWYRTTIAHNTVAVDEGNQRAVDGQLETWRDGAFAAVAGAVYPGVTLRRALAFRGQTLEDRFTCESDVEHVYDWAFHAPGKLVASVPLQSRPGALGEKNGYQHIKNVAAGRAEGDFTLTWEQEGARMRLRVKGAPGTEIFTGTGPGKRSTDAVPVVVVRRRGKTAAFDVVHEY
jgi:hypothetical protein